MNIDDKSKALWLMLVYQFPTGPDSRRVKVWRRLQSIGAVAIKNSVYVLPANEQSHEDFEWLLTELKSCGANGVILESRVVDGMTDHNIRKIFNSARSDDYQSLYEDVKGALATIPQEQAVENEEALLTAKTTLKRARKRFAEIESIDFFAAERHDSAENEIRALTQRISNSNDIAHVENVSMPAEDLENLKGRTWVTRRGVKVDRVASAWLIRRWIDPSATFKFVDEKSYSPAKGEIRFDMFEAEYTHEGDRCTFEVLARMIREHDAALRYVGEVVHDIDLKDAKFDHVETRGIANLLIGIFSGLADDDDRIERASAVFDDLYRYYETMPA